MNFTKKYYRLSSSEDVVHKPQIQRCRYCNRTSEATTFNQITHLLPELLGKNKIYTFDECDNCNATFSNYESHLSNFIRPYITLLGIRGKKKVPKFQSRTNSNIETTRTLVTHLTDIIQIECEDVRDFVIDEDSKKLKITFRKPSIVPQKVYKALLKIGLSLLPLEFDFQNRHSFSWLINDKDNISFVKNGFLTAMGNFYFPKAEALLYKAKELSSNDGIFPEYVLILKFSNQLLQIFLPFTSEITEEMIANQKINIAILPGNIFFNDEERNNRLFQTKRYDFSLKESVTEDLEINFLFDSITPNNK